MVDYVEDRGWEHKARVRARPGNYGKGQLQLRSLTGWKVGLRAPWALGTMRGTPPLLHVFAP